MDNEKDKVLEAVALEYDPEAGAPRVVASGQRLMAEQILKIAGEHDIPIYEDPELVHALNAVKIGEEIPPELYAVVAQVLLFVADMDKLMKNK